MENSADQQSKEHRSNIDYRYCLLCQQEGIQGTVAEPKSESLEKTLKPAKRFMPLSMTQQRNKVVSISKVKQSLNLNPTIQHIIGNATATLWMKEVWREPKTGKI